MKESILKILDLNVHKHLTLDELKSQLDKKRGFDKALNELLEEGLVFCTKNSKYALTSSFNYYVGEVIKANIKGVVLSYEEDGIKYSINVPEIATMGAIYKDRVLFTKDRKVGGIVKIIKPYAGNITGEVRKGHRKYIVPDNENFPLIDLDKNKDLRAQEGHKIVVKITGRNPYLIGEVTKILGHKNDPKVDILSKAFQANIPIHFSDDIMNYLEAIPMEVTPEDLEGRVDLSNHLIFTIDGKDAKDLDDAIEVIKNDDNTYTLGVHIADVSHYVQQYDLIDKEAFKRGTSIYLTDYVIPMLPHALCNGICSLNPNVLRLTLSCTMKINNNGEVIDYDIYQSYIKSKYRLNYDDVNLFFKGKYSFDKEVEEMLSSALELSKIIRKKREANGALDLDVDEAKIIVDEKGFPIDIKVRVQNDAEKLIEDFMISANETVASHIYWQNLPFVYRVHDEPKEGRFQTFCNLIAPLGYKIKGERNGVHPLELQSLLNRVKDKEIKDIVSTLMLRSLAKAKYDIINIGHFGLASECYTHFTSPIRRYPDLMVHRLIKMYAGKYHIKNMDEFAQELAFKSEQASICERKAIDLEREVEAMKKAEYMLDKIGNIYEGKVSGMLNSGIFVELPNTVEGMIRFEDMNDDYYHFDESRMIVIGEATRRIIKLGDKLTIKVKSANKEKGKVDFYLVRKTRRK